MAAGQVIGSVLGGVIGTAIAPGVGTSIGMGIGGGAGQIFDGASAKRKANNMVVPLTDPNQAAMLDEINRRRTALQSGKSTEYQLAKDLIGRGQAQTQSNVLRAGGDGGSVMQGLTMAQRTGADAMNKESAQLDQKESYYTTLANQMTDKLAQRKLELQMWEKLQKMREAAEATQAGWQNLAAGTGMAATPTTSTPTPTTMSAPTVSSTPVPFGTLSGGMTTGYPGLYNVTSLGQIGSLPGVDQFRNYGALIPQ